MSSLTSTELVVQRIEQYCERVNAEQNERFPFKVEWNERLAIDPTYNSTKYHRIVQMRGDKVVSVHCFVARTGELLKAGGFKSPAKSKDGFFYSPYNLLDDASFESLMKNGEVFGGFYGGTKIKLGA